MLLLALLVASFIPSFVLAGTPGPLLSLSGRDYSHHLKRTDEPFPTRLSFAKRGHAAVPRTLQVPATPRNSGTLLAARQALSCGSGYSLCSDGSGCCPTDGVCCTDPIMCCEGGSCCGTSCCDNNGVCCGSAGCCNSGDTCQTLNGVTGCCAAGQQCDGFTGCTDPSLIECADFPFCCPSGETCGRDASGNATCNGQDIGQNATTSADLQIPTQGDTSVTTIGATATNTPTPTTTTPSPPTSTSTSSSSSRSSSSSTAHSTSTSTTSPRPTTTGTGTTSVHSLSTTSSRGSAAGFTVPQNALIVLGLMASMALFL